MKKKLAILVSMMMAATMFAACGDDSSSSSAAADTTSSAAETTTAPEESKPEETTTAEETSSAADSATDESSATDDSSEAENVEFNGTINTDGEYAGDWNPPAFVLDDEGTTDDHLDYSYFEQYEETGCTITVNYSISKKLDMKNPELGEQFFDQYCICPASCGTAGWTHLYQQDQSYIVSDYANIHDALDPNPDKPDNIEAGTLKADYDKPAYIKDDGFIVIIPNAEGTWDDGSITFTLSPECIKYMKDDLVVNEEDGSTWGGFLFQLYGVVVNSVTLSAPEAAAE